jgi:hypothetical protein
MEVFGEREGCGEMRNEQSVGAVEFIRSFYKCSPIVRLYVRFLLTLCRLRRAYLRVRRAKN